MLLIYQRGHYIGKSKSMIFNKICKVAIFSLLLISCSVYSFKGSIPPHIKSIYISPLNNITIEAEISDIMKLQLEELLIKDNVLKLLSEKDSDSHLSLTIASFTDKPYSYDAANFQLTGYEEVNEYRITIKVKAVWFDTKNSEQLFEQEFVSWGAYDPNEDISSDGIDNDNDTFIDDLDDDEFGLPRESAMKIASRKISESIINKIVSTW